MGAEHTTHTTDGGEPGGDGKATLRPAASRPTLRVPADSPAQRARGTLDAVAHAALTRAFDAERSNLAVRANADRLLAVPSTANNGLSPDLSPGAEDHWRWLAAQNRRVADALLRVASAERELAEAARAVAKFLADADAALALIAPGPSGTQRVPAEDRETLRAPPLSDVPEASEAHGTRGTDTITTNGTPSAEVG